jgi:hypothetical protein
MNEQKDHGPLLDPMDSDAIDEYLEALYESNATLEAGQTMADIKLDRSQIRKLENLVMSTRRFSEIINHIKNQAGKDINKKQWPQIADTLLKQLCEIEEKAREIGKNDFAKIIEIKKYLARGWVKQIVAHYFFAMLKKGEDER